MIDNVRIFRIANSVIIVDNGVKRLINDVAITSKSNEEILKKYNQRKLGDCHE